MGAANNLTALKKRQLVFKRAALQSVGFTCDLFIWAGPSPAYTHTSLSYTLSTWCPHTPKIFTMVGSVPSLQSTLCTTDSTSWCTTAPRQALNPCGGHLSTIRVDSNSDERVEELESLDLSWFYWLGQMQGVELGNLLTLLLGWLGLAGQWARGIQVWDLFPGVVADLPSR